MHVLCMNLANLPLIIAGINICRGSAVFIFETGLVNSDVQLQGNWSSPAFKQYLVFAFNRKVSMPGKIANILFIM